MKPGTDTERTFDEELLKKDQKQKSNVLNRVLSMQAFRFGTNCLRG